MGADIGFDAQVPSLPQGGASLSGLGETFAPEPSTGTGTFGVHLDVPTGPNDIVPRLALRDDTGSGNGPFGLGFTLPLPRLLRSTAARYPRFDDTDTLVLEGAGELLRTGLGTYRPQVDGGAWRAEASGDGFLITARSGLRHFAGTTASSRVTRADGSVFAWHLERIEDALGNAVTVSWRRDGAQLYLDTVAYGVYTVRFSYEGRPDGLYSGRAGFPIVTRLRCTGIELHLDQPAQSLLRRWQLSYSQDTGNGASLLTGVRLSGFDAAGQQIDAPPLALTYSSSGAPSLSRFESDPFSAPGPLGNVGGSRRELIDWNGNGLPDLVDLAVGGQLRVWPNTGNGHWGPPRSVGSLPILSSASAAMGVADMDGDGVADFVRLDRLLDGYVPHDAGGSLGQPVRWRQAPAFRADVPSTRLIDLDGDGLLDVMSSSTGYLSMFYRAGADGWQPRPQVVPRSEAPDVDLADPHVFLADMNGDGSADIVRWDGGGVTFWPYLGLGRWDAPVVMATPPELPFDVDPKRLFISDVDGDGCADLIYLDQNAVRVWLNRSGLACGAERRVNWVPTGRIQDARLADMTGSGTAGILWSNEAVFGRGTAYFYLDFSGARKAGLLAAIDNGGGLQTDISYGSSAKHWARDAAAGQPWQTSLPVVIAVVDAVHTTETTTGRSGRTTYAYHDGRFDGVLREFAGFGRVDIEEAADEASPARRTVTSYHNGFDPDHPDERQDLEARLRARAIRGRLLGQEIFGIDGTPAEPLPYERLEQDWTVVTDLTPGGPVHVPRQLSSVRTSFERTAPPFRIVTTAYTAWDANGNVTATSETASIPGNPAADRTLRTLTTFSHDPAGRFVSLAARVRQFDGDGVLVADTVTEYDHTPEGQVGAQGLITRRTALVLQDATAGAVYGADQPDFAALGYFRRAGEDGWWVQLAAYDRADDASGLRGSVTGPLGAVTSFTFDASGSFPNRIADPAGNVTTATVDLRAAQIDGLTKSDGGMHSVSFDALGRPTAFVQPGDTAGLPTVVYTYNTATTPHVRQKATRAVSGEAAVIVEREIYDGAGLLLQRTARDEAGDIVLVDQVYSGRGLLLRMHMEHRMSGGYAVPAVTLLHTRFAYDPMGRPVLVAQPDGAIRTFTYGPGFIDEADEEDTRTDAAAQHAGTSTRRHVDATGRIASIEERISGRTVVSSYEYDTHGRLLRHTDTLGRTVATVYDCLGQPIAVSRPEQQTVAVLDAAGNVVEARSAGGGSVFRRFDPLNRPTAVALGSHDAAPSVRYVYHDAGAPAPPDAGVHTTGGHLVRVDDESGTTLFDYDERGRAAVKRWHAPGDAKEYRLDYAYRSDGQLATLMLPDGGAGRRTVAQQYNQRGLVTAVSDAINAIEYDLAGRRTRVAYVNATQETYTYDAATGRLSSATVQGPSGVLRSTSFTLDRVGNLLAVSSPDPALSATYRYDDFYRLVEASHGNGEHWTYAFDDAGNLTSKSDIGAYRYGEGGAPATVLTSAGADAFTYNARGELVGAPWGTLAFDALGRLKHVQDPAQDRALTFLYNHAGARVAARSSGAAAPPLDLVTPDASFSMEDGALVLWPAANVRLEDGGTFVLHGDHLGSIVLVTDATGQVVERRRYDPYGAILERTGDGAPSPTGFAGGTAADWTNLVYFQARYYDPRIGRFISPDTIVQNVYDPMAWAAYTYCRGNPTSYVDPMGHDFWRIFLAVLAVIALVVLTIVTFGTTTPFSGALAASVIIGVIAGGVVGGITAARAKGDFGDILAGILVGAAVGGWAAFAGAAITANIGMSGILGGAIKGLLSGAVNGLAMGFAAGFGGKYELTDFLNTLWQSVLIGAVTGAALGALSGALESGDISKPKTSIQENAEKEVDKFTGGDAMEKARIQGTPGMQTIDPPDQAGSLSRPGPTGIDQLPKKLGSEAFNIVKPQALFWGAKLSAIIPVQIFLIDATSGTWSVARKDIIDYVRRHNVNISI